MRTIIQLIWRAIKSRIYLDESFILYEYKSVNNIESSVDLVKADKKNLSDVLMFDTKTNYKVMTRMLSKGEKGILAYIEGKCIHRSWYKEGSGKVDIYKFLPFYLKENEAYIYYCATAEEMRGKNVYPFVISYIAQMVRGSNRVFIATSNKNIASMRGIEKAGFEPVELWRIRVIMGIKRRYRRPIELIGTQKQ